MVDEHNVSRIARALPGVDVDDASLHVRASGTLFAWPYPERVPGKRARVPRRDIFAIRVANLADKQALLVGEPEIFFTTDHYDRYPVVMVRLEAIDRERLIELLIEAHAAAVKQRPKRLHRA